MSTSLVTSPALPPFLSSTDSPIALFALNAPDEWLKPFITQSLATHAARAERVGVVIGHNRFDVHALARWAKEHQLDPARLLTRVELARAFSCHQLYERVRTLAPAAHAWRALYVLGLLETFYDEPVKYAEAVWLLNETLKNLKSISRALPTLITLSPPRTTGRASFIPLVERYADVYWEFTRASSHDSAPRQRVFGER